MKVLITGVNGFIGSNIASYLYAKGYNVIGASQKNWNMAEHLIVDLTDIKATLQLFLHVKPDVCIHCAGSASVPMSFQQPQDDFSKNVIITSNVLESIRQSSHNTRFIYFSSAAVYGNPIDEVITEDTMPMPISPYGYNKLMSELLIQQYVELYKISALIFRPFSVYGPGIRKQVVYDLFCKFTRTTDDTVSLFGTGNETRDFIYISDLCHVVELCINKKLSGIYNIASGNSTSIAELAYLVKNVLASDKSIQFEGHSRLGDPMNWKVNVEKLDRVGYSAKVSIKEGIQLYYEWFKNN